MKKSMYLFILLCVFVATPYQSVAFAEAEPIDGDPGNFVSTTALDFGPGLPGGLAGAGFDAADSFEQSDNDPFKLATNTNSLFGQGSGTGDQGSGTGDQGSGEGDGNGAYVPSFFNRDPNANFFSDTKGDEGGGSASRNVDFRTADLEADEIDKKALSNEADIDEMLTDLFHKMKHEKTDLMTNQGVEEGIASYGEQLYYELYGAIDAMIEANPELANEEVIVLDVLNFTRVLKAIDGLLNPPANLHPWLKWMLYLKRVSPEMLQYYEVALNKRDRIFTLASKSKGKLQVRVDGQLMDVPVYVWPEEAKGSYELVMVREPSTSSRSGAPGALPGAGNPSTGK